MNLIRIIFNYSIFIFILLSKPSLGLAYQEPIPDIIFAKSENGKFLIHILPIIDFHSKKKEVLKRNSLIILVYKRPEKRPWNWEEICFFRVAHPYKPNTMFAEVERTLISNDGNSILIQSQ